MEEEKTGEAFQCKYKQKMLVFGKKVILTSDDDNNLSCIYFDDASKT